MWVNLDPSLGIATGVKGIYPSIWEVRVYTRCYVNDMLQTSILNSLWDRIINIYIHRTWFWFENFVSCAYFLQLLILHRIHFHFFVLPKVLKGLKRPQKFETIFPWIYKKGLHGSWLKNMEWHRNKELYIERFGESILNSS